MARAPATYVHADTSQTPCQPLTAELSTSIMGGTAGRDMPSDAK